jgi:uncharacterized protein
MAASGNDRRIDYVEFLVRDIARSRAFYGDAFGWSFKDYGPDYCEFNDGRLTGGFALDETASPGGATRAGGALVILFATDLDATKARLERAGAKIVKPPYPFPGGRRFHFADPDGYELAVWSDK